MKLMLRGGGFDMKDDAEIDIPLTRPDVSLEDIEGHEQVKLILRDLALMIRLARERPELTITPRARHTSIFLYGPPGADKLRLAMAMARECGAYFIPVDCRDSQDELTGFIPMGGPERIKAIFAKAAENIPCTIFLSEIDAIAHTDNADSPRILASRYSLLNELNRPRDWVVVMAATNRMDLLDVYIWGKFLKQLEVDSKTRLASAETLA
jgi:SpoVK/Ycf46/Vps4 family AAA+-type ATPase